MAERLERLPPEAPATGSQLIVPALALERLIRLARKGYPHEVCGLLVGRERDLRTQIDRVTSARNLARDRPADRYLLDPDDFLAADIAARRAGREIVGIWHTHPDHPARPSPTDLASAWPGYTYLILSVRRDGVADVTAWQLDGDRFVERRVQESTP